jgi:hypothetical protein
VTFVLALVFFLALASGDASAGMPRDASLPRREVLELAVTAYRRVEAAGLTHNHVLTVIDYSLPSSERRLWVVNPASRRVLFHEFVAHGRGSGTDDAPERAVRFGNDPDSHRSSLGTFLTGATYSGKHGYSLELIGLDPGVNDRAIERRIVMHPAQYVSAAYRAEKGGRVGRSWGCPALDPAIAAEIIDRIQEGGVIYVAGGTSRPAPPPNATLARAGAALAAPWTDRRPARPRVSR